MEQVLRTDRAAWIKMAEKLTSLKRLPDGKLPLDKALADLQTDPAVMFHLVPLPQGKAPSPPAKPQPQTKAETQTDRPASVIKKDKTRPKGRGKGGKGKPQSKGKMPAELIGLHQQDKSGRRMCYNYNLARGCELASNGQTCPKGAHVCMRCFGAHPAHQCTGTLA